MEKRDILRTPPPTLNKISNRAKPDGVKKFHPLPKGEGRGEGERRARFSRPLPRTKSLLQKSILIPLHSWFLF
jgi:hypothetical protein